jgi:hypothetical protein
VKEMYPYPDDGIIDDEPVSSLFDLDCQGPDWRVATVCHSCFHKLDVDMWISEHCWSSLSPIMPFEQLPLLQPRT